MTKPLAILAAAVTLVSMYLSTRAQAFTHVTIDGRDLRMLVMGQGPITVVFENGAGASLEMWGKVQPAVSQFARTVSYDRAGSRLSDPVPGRRDGRRISSELRRALTAAGIQPPYILAGASVGGPYVRIFAGTYPHDVAGMVLVDPTTDQQRFDDADGAAFESWSATREQSAGSNVPPGIPVMLIDAISPLEVPFASERIRAMRRKNRPEIEADTIEYGRWLSTFSGGKMITTHRSGHNVTIEEPRLVVETIRQIVADIASRLP
ncbi:MAG TPA: alpha/beta fold hydrolase [Vicinamibacterales bacterium]|jgi:pimeloyl-ACP methyl ester carboxylesterase